jgi:hypothetical protein
MPVHDHRQQIKAVRQADVTLTRKLAQFIQQSG